MHNKCIHIRKQVKETTSLLPESKDSVFFFTAKDSELAASGCNVNEAHKN